jgi:hypothetical protein
LTEPMSPRLRLFACYLFLGVISAYEYILTMLLYLCYEP